MRFAVGFWILGCILMTLTGCATSRSSVAPGWQGDAVEPYLVQVTDVAPDAGNERVTLSVWEISAAEPLAERLPEGAAEAMRRHAANHGAQVLWMERLDTPWRKAFYGTGLVRRADAAPLHSVPACEGAEYVDAVARAQRGIQRCLADVGRRRRGLKGQATVVLRVDAFGGVYSAAITPDSSRDGEVQACLMNHAGRQRYGSQDALVCRGEITAAVP